MHKIDIVIPTYNYGRYLDACLRSVMEQTFDDFQVLVIDNASEDNTEALMQEWVQRDSRVRYVRNVENIGSAGSVRKAYGMTSAPYWMTLCADDLLLPEFLEKIVENGLEKHEECGFGYSLVHRLTDDGLVPDMYQHVPRLETGVHDILYHLCFTNWILMSFGVCRRRCVDEMQVHERHRLKFYDGSPRRGNLGDHYQWLLLASKWPTFVVNERQGIYRVHSGNDTNTTGYQNIREETAILYDIVYYDKDVFPAAARYVARINQIGRLFTAMGICGATISMLHSGETGPIVRLIFKEILEKISTTLRQFYFDDSSGKLSHLQFELESNLDKLATLAAKI